MIKEKYCQIKTKLENTQWLKKNILNKVMD